MQLNPNLSDAAIQSWQIVRDGVNQNLNSFTHSVQQFGQSVQQTATQTTDNAKASLENNWHAVEKITNTTSEVMQKAINTSVNDWLAQYPLILKILEIFAWGINHPVRGVIFLLFIIALLWSIIKAIVKLIETASWSILKIPFILIQRVLKFLWLTFNKLEISGINKIRGNHLNNNFNPIRFISANIYQNKKQRLAEISHRLAVIHNEQQELLQEATKLMKSDSQNIIINPSNQERSI